MPFSPYCIGLAPGQGDADTQKMVHELFDAHPRNCDAEKLCNLLVQQTQALSNAPQDGCREVAEQAAQLWLADQVTHQAIASRWHVTVSYMRRHSAAMMLFLALPMQSMQSMH